MSDQIDNTTPPNEEEKPGLEPLEGELPVDFSTARRVNFEPVLSSWKLSQAPFISQTDSADLPDEVEQPSIDTRYRTVLPRTDDFRSRDEVLDSLRKAMGEEQYQAQVEKFGEDNLYKLVSAAGEDAVIRALKSQPLMPEKFPSEQNPRPYPGYTSTSSTTPQVYRSNKVRMRELSSRVNRFVLWAALAYGAVVGALYPDGALVGEIYNSLLPIVCIIILIVSAVLVFKTGSFDFSVIFTTSVVITIVLTPALGLVGNLIKLGWIPFALAGLAFAGCYSIGMLIGRPIFRWIESKQLEKRVWIIQLAAVLLALLVLVAGWFGISALFLIM